MSTENSDSQESCECPTCGRDDFESRSGMKIHHSRTHGESISGEEVACAYCGTSVRLPRYKIERSENHFCDTECMGKWRAENLTGEDAPNWRGGPVEVTCEHCGDVFEVKRAKYESDSPRSNTKYCSIQCRDASFVGQYGGEENPRWEGGEFSYGPGWNDTTRRRVREREAFQCYSCGMTEQEHKDRDCQKLHIHHICGARNSTNPVVYNAPGIWCFCACGAIGCGSDILRALHQTRRRRTHSDQPMTPAERGLPPRVLRR